MKPRDVATLVLVNVAIHEIVRYRKLHPDVLGELEYLEPHLDSLVMGLETDKALNDTTHQGNAV